MPEYFYSGFEIKFNVRKKLKISLKYMELLSKTGKKKLLKQVNQGESQAFEEFYGLYVKKIYRFIYYRINSKQDAQDLTSETFCRAWQSVAQGSKIENLKAFIYRIAHNLVVDFYAQQQKALLELKEELKETLPDERGLDKNIDVDLNLKQVKKAIGKLSDSCQEVIIMRFLDELSISEISQILGKSKNNIYVLIHRALKAVKEELK